MDHAASQGLCGAVLALVAGALAGQDRGRIAEATDVDDAMALVLADGQRLRLQGLSLPSLAVRGDGFDRRLREFLRQQAVGRQLSITTDAVVAGESVAVVRVLPLVAGEPSLNEQALAAGLAVLSCRTPGVQDLQQLAAAAQRAQAANVGWFARAATVRRTEIPFLNGAVLGLYYKEDRFDYRRQIDELAAAGFRHVCLLLSAMIADVEAHDIDHRHRRTVSDARLIETVALARGKGMTVMLMPVLLLERAAESDWRGTLRPKDEAAFWLEYDDFLAHYLDIAEATGVSIFSIGSELGSLEDRTETWRRLIVNARGRFRGWLTYSANWDHVHVPRFFGQLDFVGLTGYFSLTQKDDPTLSELIDAWRRVGDELRQVVGKLGKPVVLTELGYVSQNGTNRDPWNYLIDVDAIDLAEQEQCFRAFLAVAPSLEFLRGAYFFDYFETGGPDDHTYSPRGKPAFAQWQRWAGHAPVESRGR